MTGTISYSHGTSAIPLLAETIGANLDRTVARVPDAEALVSRHQGIRYTYAQFAEAIDLVARGLLACGLEVGDRLGIWSPNYAEWALVQYACHKIGVIVVNVNPAYRPHELEYALGQSGCRILVAAPSFKTSDYVAMVEQVRPQLPGLERVVFLFSPGWDELCSDGGSVAIDRLRAREAELDFDQPVSIMYTSGTTGAPKGATLSHHNVLNNAFFIAEQLGYNELDRLCMPLPYYHTFGMVVANLGCTSHGACVVLPEASFEPTAVLASIEAERCTSLYGVPTMFIAMLELPDFHRFDLTSLRTGVMGGSPCPVEVMKQVVSTMHMEDVSIVYGMTETTVSTQTRTSDTVDKRVSTVGVVHPHIEIKVADPVTRHAVPRGMPGELCTRGYSVMIGYWNDPDRTAEAVDQHGWMHTGDLATMDDDGYLNIVGRSKDMIIRGGENVYPREVEEFLHTHPDIVDVQVVGVPDARYGEEVMAWIKVRDGAVLTGDDVKGYCREQIAYFKIPRYVKFTAEFPMTVTGKVQKFKMREHAIAELGLREAAGVQTA